MSDVNLNSIKSPMNLGASGLKGESSVDREAAALDKLDTLQKIMPHLDTILQAVEKSSHSDAKQFKNLDAQGIKQLSPTQLQKLMELPEVEQALEQIAGATAPSATRALHDDRFRTDSSDLSGSHENPAEGPEAFHPGEAGWFQERMGGEP